MTDTDYTPEQTFTPGQRVELHPGCDLWMRGARFGTVRRQIQSTHVRVYVDRVGLKTFAPSRLRPVE